MDRQTVDFGVDLGTTNSIIARATPTGVEVVRNDHDQEITPSAVAIDRDGNLLVGTDALDQADPPPALAFKRMMGTDTRIPVGPTQMLPEELSAEVLKALKAAAHVRYNEEPRHVVVTIPAMFLQPQCAATHRAADIAGLNAVALVQEPIAAATAYLGTSSADGCYLVFDLGGGTFDATIIRLRDQEMTVLGHGGDNWLGGSDWDREVVDWALRQLEPLHGTLPELRQGSRKCQLLRMAAESARKRLTTRESAVLDLSDLGLSTAKLTLSRKVLESLIEESVDRAVRLAQDRLDESRVRAEGLRAVLLVGGPTRTPYLRTQLSERLGVPLALDRDPMSVVATGAAIHASTLLISEHSTVSLPVSTATACLDLHYEPVVQDRVTTLSGRVLSPPGFAGEVKIESASRDITTGWIKLHDGAFVTELTVDDAQVTEYRVSIRDIRGTLVAVQPSGFSIRLGVAPARPVTPYRYGVALDDGGFGCVLECGIPLPAYGRSSFRVSKPIAAGSNESAMVYFLEGLSDIASDNTKVGELRVSGTDLQRTLREGEEVEVRIRMDESRLLKARVMVPLYDLEWDVELASLLDRQPEDDLEASLSEARTILDGIREDIAPDDQDAYIRAAGDLDRIEADLDRTTASDAEAAQSVAKKLADAKPAIRALARTYELTAKHRRAHDRIEQAEALADEFSDALALATLGDLRGQADRALDREDPRGLEAVTDKAGEIFWQHYVKKRECWIGLVAYLQERRVEATDGAAYHEFLKRAEDCLVREDFDGVRLNGGQAMKYLPSNAAREDRMYDSLLRRA